MTTATCPRPIALPSRLRTVVPGFLQRHRAVLEKSGPYAAIALVLPGGFFLALLLWLYRRHQRLAKATAKKVSRNDMHGTPFTG